MTLAPFIHYASKLAKGKNQVIVDATMNAKWPIAEGVGGMQFKKKFVNDVEGYLIVH